MLGSPDTNCVCELMKCSATDFVGEFSTFSNVFSNFADACHPERSSSSIDISLAQNLMQTYC
jgi:hypothetical protein